jgi:hypothetical protein
VALRGKAEHQGPEFNPQYRQKTSKQKKKTNLLRTKAPLCSEPGQITLKPFNVCFTIMILAVGLQCLVRIPNILSSLQISYFDPSFFILISFLNNCTCHFQIVSHLKVQ